MSKGRSIAIPFYVTVVRLEEATDGSLCYVAFHPELPTCMAQGETPAEAEENLQEATLFAIEHLQKHGLPIPQPQTTLALTGFEVGSATFPTRQQVRSFPSINAKKSRVPI